MRKLALLQALSLICLISSAQDTSTTFLRSFGRQICTCIDTIRVTNRTKTEVSGEIRKCIEDKVVAYQLSTQLTSIDTSGKLNPKSGKKEINLTLNTNKDSKEYKQYYYELERYLMENCSSIKDIAAANDKVNKHSLSTNQLALDLYYRGIDEAKAGNLKEAIELYERALRIDSVFAFAWDNIGIASRRLENYDKALYAYNKSLEIDPTGQMPLQNIAIVYQYKKEYQKAIDAYKRLSELDSTNAEVFYGIGQIYIVYLDEYELGLDNVAKAYNIYTHTGSPYRTDAEKLIQLVYQELKKKGKEDRFYEIMKANNISVNKKQ